jgi:hypothetical protein
MKSSLVNCLFGRFARPPNTLQQRVNFNFNFNNTYARRAHRLKLRRRLPLTQHLPPYASCKIKATGAEGLKETEESSWMAR